MSAGRFITVPASTVLTGPPPGAPCRDGIGLAVIDGQLCVAIADRASGQVMVARLHQSVLNEFAGVLADHLTEVSPVVAETLREAEIWPTMQ